MKHLALGQAPVARMHGCDRGLVLLLSATGELVYDAIGHLGTPHGGRRDSPRAPQRGDATLLRGVPNRKVFVTSRLHRSTAAPAYLSSSRDSTRQSCTCSGTHPGPVAHKVPLATPTTHHLQAFLMGDPGLEPGTLFLITEEPVSSPVVSSSEQTRKTGEVSARRCSRLPRSPRARH